MAGLKNRLRQVEMRFKTQIGNRVTKPEFINLFDLPRETVIGAFDVLKDAMLGQGMLKLDRSESTNQTEYISFDQFMPEQLYDLMKAER